MHRISIACSCLFSCVLAVSSQTAQPDTPSQLSVKTTSEEVVVDVIVRDKKGRAVTDLKPGDFTISDNGARKSIKTFRLVEGAEAVSASGARTQLDPLRQIRLVTFIFDNLDVNSRQLARGAALELLKAELPQNVYMAVMTIDHKLEALQPFTNDRDLLRKAIDRATSHENTDFSADTARVETQLQNMIGPSTDSRSTDQRVSDLSTGAAAPSGPGAAPNGAAVANQLMARMMLDMLEGERNMAMTQAGRAQIFALLDAIKDQYRLPGRKTILYFSAGLFLPQGTEAAFENVKAIANRNNVSVYCIDARGLTTTATNRDSMNALNEAATASRQQQTNPNGAVTRQEAHINDTSINSTRLNTQENLATLAESTGGTLIANTNDFRSPLRKIGEDIETYYEIGYNPEIQNYDGSFHKIAVRTDVRDLRLQTRSGYFALPPAMTAAGAIHPYEVPLLRALDSTPLPRTFEFHAAGLHFRGGEDRAICDVVVDMPLGNLTLEENKQRKDFDGRFSFVAVVKDAHGAVIRKFDDDIPLNVPPDKMNALKDSHFIYTEHFDLPPGHYRLESAVMEGEGNKISARKAVLVIPESTSALSLSSVVPVRSMKPKTAEAEQTDPFVVGNDVVTPSLDPTVSKAATTGLPFYLEIYTNRSNDAKPELVLEISKDGQPLGSGSPALSAPDARGRIQYIATAPLTRLEPGSYQVRFVVKQGNETASEAVGFTLVP